MQTHVKCEPCCFGEIVHLRDLYRAEMKCQILRDSFHQREGWVEWYGVTVDGDLAGYGAVVVGGPWAGSRALFEVFIVPAHRGELMRIASLLLVRARVGDLLVQTNDPTMTFLMNQFASEPVIEKVVFVSCQASALPNPGTKRLRREDVGSDCIFPHTREPVGDWLLQYEDEIVATGGYLKHYNPPYVDVYMEVREDRRRRGFGGFLVQELRKIAESEGKILCGRCDPDNIASYKAMTRAGLVPCAHRISAKVRGDFR